MVYGPGTGTVDGYGLRFNKTSVSRLDLQSFQLASSACLASSSRFQQELVCLKVDICISDNDRSPIFRSGIATSQSHNHGQTQIFSKLKDKLVLTLHNNRCQGHAPNRSSFDTSARTPGFLEEDQIKWTSFLFIRAKQCLSVIK
jgi:hypothetical protein